MILQIDLQVFVNLFTHNLVCDGQCFGGYDYKDLVKQIQDIDPEHTICYIEDPEGNPRLWSINGWIQERQRQIDRDLIIKELQATNAARVARIAKEQEDSIVKKDSKPSARNNAIEELLKMGIKL